MQGIELADPEDNTAGEGAHASREQAGGTTGDSSSSNAGNRSWHNLLELDASIYKQKRIRLLTPEARVLIYLKLTGSVSVTKAMQVAGISYRGFYAVLERLKQAGLIAQVKDKKDQRVRNLSLDPSMPLTPDNL